MMATDRRRYRRVHPACTFLIKSFAPGCPTMLRTWTSKLERRAAFGEDGRATKYVERVTIIYDLPDAEARKRAEKLVRQAPSLRLTAVGGKSIDELTAEVSHDRLLVTALLVRAD